MYNPNQKQNKKRNRTYNSKVQIVGTTYTNKNGETLPTIVMAALDGFLLHQAGSGKIYGSYKITGEYALSKLTKLGYKPNPEGEYVSLFFKEPTEGYLSRLSDNEQTNKMQLGFFGDLKVTANRDGEPQLVCYVNEVG